MAEAAALAEAEGHGLRPIALAPEAETVNENEQQYLDLCRKILERGVARDDRTHTGTMSLFGETMRFSLRGGVVPLLTTKRVFVRGIVEELFWMLRGSTDAKDLAQRGVHFWDANATRKFLDARGLEDNREGDLGPVYGFQWRHCGADYRGADVKYRRDEGVDQISQIIETIRKDPTSRRMVLSAWNPHDIPYMALPPCHMMCQFYVDGGNLDCLLFQRSGDMGLGVPFNIASYAILAHLIAHVTGCVAREFTHVIGDAHIYSNHIGPIREQLRREVKVPPTIKINKDTTDIDVLAPEDIEIVGYDPHPSIRMEMAV